MSEGAKQFFSTLRGSQSLLSMSWMKLKLKKKLITEIEDIELPFKPTCQKHSPPPRWGPIPLHKKTVTLFPSSHVMTE